MPITTTNIFPKFKLFLPIPMTMIIDIKTVDGLIELIESNKLKEIIILVKNALKLLIITVEVENITEN
ncbi:hypothetical protein FLAN108750_01675 [Flavobacterium antarcticum]